MFLNFGRKPRFLPRLALCAIGAQLLACLSVSSARAIHSYSSATFNGAGNGGDTGYAIAIDTASGVVFVGGSVDEGPGAGGVNGWIARYDTSLNFLSAITMNGSANGKDSVAGMVLDGNGNLFVIGTTSQTYG
ncbi:MAG: hypothetical protein HY547_02990, partial [Elusimicrobia bacterium]|nr:hypothetical protein [Elusimicrobiota bacterium]